MMKIPSIAVFLACYNQEEFIEESVRSAADQDYDNLVVFIGDDGSTDNTLDLIESLALEYGERIFVVPDKKHLGITGNSSRLLAFCRQADFISFHAGDDVYLPGKIRAQIDWFIDHHEGVLCGHDSEYFENNTGNKIFLYSERIPMITGRGLSYFSHSPCLYDALSIMVRSSAIPEDGYDKRIKVCSDFKLWLDILSAGGEYGFVEGIYTKHRIHSFNVTNNASQNAKDMCEAYSVIAKDYPELKQICKDQIFALKPQSPQVKFFKQIIAFFLHLRMRLVLRTRINKYIKYLSSRLI